MSVKSRPLTTCFSLLEAKEKLHFLQPEKRTLRFFFALRALQFWKMVLVFHYYQQEFCLNIFLDLKSKQNQI